MRTFIEFTDHLSDQEFYTSLWTDVLCEGTYILNDESCVRRINMVGSGSEEDTYLWLKYYADDETRAWWMEEYPNYEIPAHEDPPYQRDHRLPRP